MTADKGWLILSFGGLAVIAIYAMSVPYPTLLIAALALEWALLSSNGPL
jgi:hypothetical protein